MDVVIDNIPVLKSISRHRRGVSSWVDNHGKQHYLRHNGPEHVLCYAPTRSGKGVGLVVSTLLSWGDSAVITDLKGELWALTAGNCSYPFLCCRFWLHHSMADWPLLYLHNEA